jgi:hypothetical protein
MERIDQLMDLMRNSEDFSWIADQLSSTFDQGVLIKAKEAQEDSRFASLSYHQSTQESKKREKYETSRPYSDQEKLDLLTKAITAVFEVLPAIQNNGIKTLKKFNESITRIEFLSPNSTEQNPSYSIDLLEIDSKNQRLKENAQKFIQELKK